MTEVAPDTRTGVSDVRSSTGVLKLKKDCGSLPLV